MSPSSAMWSREYPSISELELSELKSSNMETPKTKKMMEPLLKRFDRAYDNPYYLRVANNHFTLLEVSEKLTENGFECFTANDEFEHERVHYVTAYRDGKMIRFGFSEVPYRWWVNNSHCFNGDVIGLRGRNGYDYPFELDYLISHAVACSSKELEEYERKKSDKFYRRIGNFSADCGNLPA